MLKCLISQVTFESYLNFKYQPLSNISIVFNNNTKHSVLAKSLVVSNSLQPCELGPARLLCPWDSPDKNTGVICYSLLQGIFPIQRRETESPKSPTRAGGLFTTSVTWAAQECS